MLGGLHLYPFVPLESRVLVGDMIKKTHNTNSHAHRNFNHVTVLVSREFWMPTCLLQFEGLVGQLSVHDILRSDLTKSFNELSFGHPPANSTRTCPVLGAN